MFLASEVLRRQDSSAECIQQRMGEVRGPFNLDKARYHGPDVSYKSIWRGWYQQRPGKRVFLFRDTNSRVREGYPTQLHPTHTVNSSCLNFYLLKLFIISINLQLWPIASLYNTHTFYLLFFSVHCLYGVMLWNLLGRQVRGSKGVYVALCRALCITADTCPRYEPIFQKHKSRNEFALSHTHTAQFFKQTV